MPRYFPDRQNIDDVGGADRRGAIVAQQRKRVLDETLANSRAWRTFIASSFSMGIGGRAVPLAASRTMLAMTGIMTTMW